MSATTMVYNEKVSILREGWEILVEQLGILKATQFVMLLGRGKGDTVQEITEYWGDASIEEIHNQVVAWKAKRMASEYA
jgi:hypothetical protein